MRIRFGECSFDTVSRQLSREGKSVPLSEKAVRLLELLLENRPRMLSRTQLRERLWPGTAPPEGILAALVLELHGSIEGKGQSDKLIEMVPGVGYAFRGKTVDDRFRLIYDEREIFLAAGENILGRDLEAIAQIEDRRASRRHARIVIAGKDATIEDLASQNGTFVGGEKIVQPRRLRDNDRIQIGSAVLTFRALPE